MERVRLQHVATLPLRSFRVKSHAGPQLDVPRRAVRLVPTSTLPSALSPAVLLPGGTIRLPVRPAPS